MYLLSSFPIVPAYMNEMLTYVTIALSLMVFLIALFWMAAQFLRKPEYESFASVELHQLLISALFFLLIFGAAYFAQEIANAFAGGDMFAVGRNYLNYILNNMALPAVMNLEILKLISQYMGSWTMRWGASVWGVVIPAFPSFVVVERVVDFALLLISPFTASLIVQMAILEVIGAVALPFVLPAGVVLRIFPPTRDAGAFLISAALGFGLVYPFTYVMHDRVVMRMVSGGIPYSGAEYLGASYGNVLSEISENGAFRIDQWLFSPFVLLSYLMLQALFLPALSITITIAFIKGTTKFISQKLS